MVVTDRQTTTQTDSDAQSVSSLNKERDMIDSTDLISADVSLQPLPQHASVREGDRVIQAVCVEHQQVIEAEVVARENSPDSKNKSRRIWFCIAVALLSVLAMVAATSAALPKGPKEVGIDEDKYRPILSLDDLYQQRVEVLREIVAPLNTGNVFDENSPEFSSDRKDALDWLVRDNWDSWITIPGDERMIRQRYITALFYFSTNGPAWEKQFLFLTNRGECDWSAVHNGISGLVCNRTGFLEGINMEWNNLSGTIPPELSYFSDSLVEIKVEGGSLSGTIPPSFAELTMLETLGLNDHCLTGSIPDLSDVPNLQLLTLQNNPKLSGSLNGFCNGREYRNASIDVVASSCGSCSANEGSAFVECDCCTCCNEDDFTCCDSEGDSSTSLYLNDLSTNGFVPAFDKQCLSDKNKEWIEQECPCIFYPENSFRKECTKDCNTEGAIPSNGH